MPHPFINEAFVDDDVRRSVDRSMGFSPFPGGLPQNDAPYPSAQTPGGITERLMESGQGLSAPPGPVPAPAAPPPQPPAEDVGKYTGVMDFLRGSASDLLDSHPSRKGLSQTLADPTRRALLAFAAGMMDTSAPKWQQLDFGTQMSRALNAGLDEYAKATKSTFKPPKIFEKKFWEDGKRWSQQGYMDWQTGKFVGVGKKVPLDKPGEEKGAKATAPKEQDYTAPSWRKYLKTKDRNDLVLKPFDYGHLTKKAEATARGKDIAADAHWETELKQYADKRDVDYSNKVDFEATKQDMMMAKWYEKQGYQKPPKRGDNYSWEKGEHRHFEVFDGTKWVHTKSSKWNPQARAKTRLYTMPDKTKLTLSEILRLYKANNPREASGLAGFAMAINDPENAKKWMFGAEGKGSFGRWLDKIGFDRKQFSYLEGREPRKTTDKVIRPRTQADIDNAPSGSIIYDEETGQKYRKP